MFTPCGKCENGYLYDGDEARVCECLQEYRRKRNLEIRLTKSGIPLRIADYDISDYRGELSLPVIQQLKFYVSQFDEKFRAVSLYLWSRRNSTQKTTVASWIGRELISRGHTAYMVIMDKLLKDLQEASFDATGAIEQRIEVWLDCDFLIIDDSFDPKKVTVYKSGYQFPFLDNFLRRRLEIMGKATCFTANIPIAEIGRTFGPSITALVKRSVPEAMEFRDSLPDAKTIDPSKLWPKDLLGGRR